MRRVLLLVVLGMGLVVFGLGRVAGQPGTGLANFKCITQKNCSTLGVVPGVLGDGTPITGCDVTQSGTTYFVCGDMQFEWCENGSLTSCVGTSTINGFTCYVQRWSCD